MKQVSTLLLCIGLIGSFAACERRPSTIETLDPALDPASLSETALLAASCSGCHLNGGSGVPSLEGLKASDLTARTLFYKQDIAGTTVMHRLARGYSESDLIQIADYLGVKDE